MYRVSAAICVLSLSAAVAHASSIQDLAETSDGTPSIIAIGSDEQPTLEGIAIGSETSEDGETPRYQVGGSILAFGAEAIPAAPVAVASIDPVAEEKAETKGETPFVIRGGVVGDAFAATPPETVELPDETAAGEPSEPVEPAEPVEPQG